MKIQRIITAEGKTGVATQNRYHRHNNSRLPYQYLGIRQSSRLAAKARAGSGRI